MSRTQPDNPHELDAEVAGAIDRIAATETPDHAVSKLIASQASTGSLDNRVETSTPLEMNGYKKESKMRSPLNSKLSKLALWKWTTFGATAATLVLLLGMMFFTEHASAFAKMQKAIKQFDTLQFTIEIYQPGSDEVWRSSKSFIKGEDFFREEQALEELGNPISVYDFSNGRFLKYSETLNRAAVGKISESLEEQFRMVANPFIDILTNVNAEEADEVNRYETDGRSYIEYEYEAVAGPRTMLVHVTVDAETSLPVEIQFYDLDGELERTISNIVFDESIDDSFFSTDAPDGYEVVERDM